jgi:hypothetical protein
MWYQLTFLISFIALVQSHLAFSAPDTRSLLQPIHLDPTWAQIIRRGVPLAYRPFSVKDPATGAGREDNALNVAPYSTFTFPTGKKVKVGRYYEELNQFEHSINSFGYSLRDTTQKWIPFGFMPLDSMELDAKRKDTESKHHETEMLSRLPLETIQQAYDEELSKMADFLKKLQAFLSSRSSSSAAQAKTVHQTKGWSESWGWSSKVASSLDAHAVVDGTPSQVSSQAEVSAGGTLFGQQLKIIHGEANYQAPLHGDLQGEVSYYVLGYKLFNKEYKNQDSYFFEDQWSQWFDLNTNIDLYLGPIPIVAKIGVRGDTSLDFRMKLLPLRTQVDLVPSVHTKVYLQLGSNVAIGEGVGEDLVFVDDSLWLASGISLVMDEKSPSYLTQFYADDELSTLDGSLGVTLFTYVPKWGMPAWAKIGWNWKVFDLKGVHARGALFKTEDRTPLF